MTDTDKARKLEELLQFYGRIGTPIIEKLPEKVEDLQSAMLCTMEGFNVCSIGFAKEKISQMAAVSSSVYAMSSSVVSAFSKSKEGEPNIIFIDSDLVNILGKRIRLPDGNSLILLIAFSSGTKLGMQQYTAQYIEDELCKQIPQAGN
ncbi:MAG: hypothetical protein CSB24_03490 [Deltaproteobacteria bacterium]|nr:MAG: hypothetical protein CSB24_03490 [Deltaproteobacteria bacterium]